VTAQRRKRSAAARVRPFWLPIALVAVIVLAAIAVAATWPGFAVKRVEVTGNERVSRAEILARAQVARERSIWLQATGAMSRRIEEIPYIATASIHRVPPATLRIVVTERVPFAALRSGAQIVTVDRTLRVLSMGSPGGLPVFILQPGIELRPGRFVLRRDAAILRDADDAMAARQIKPLAIGFDRYGGLVIALRGGVRLLLGQERDLAQKVTLVDAILAQVVRGQRRVAAIDVRAPGTPVVVYR
jgi:cell division protein FtsQ